MKQPKELFGIDQTFIDEITSQTVDQLKATIVRLQIQNEENEAFKESQEYIQAKSEYDLAKEKWNEVAGPIRDVTKVIKNKTKLVIDRLKEKGAV